MRRFSGFSFFPLISFYFIPSFKFVEFSRRVKTVRHNDGRSFFTSYPCYHLVCQNHDKYFIYLHIQRCCISRHSCQIDKFDLLGKPLGKLKRNAPAIALTYCWTLLFAMRSLKKALARWKCSSKRTSTHVLE